MICPGRKMFGALLNSKIRTPKGVATFLPERTYQKRYIEELLLSLFRSWGFQEVVTPAFEYLDVLSVGIDEALLDKSYKITDRASGRVMLLRPDLTLQIAKLVATTLSYQRMPLRLCYSASAYRYSPEHGGRQREIPQAGVELIGLSGSEADAEIIALVVESLLRLGLEGEFKIAIGQAEFFRGIINGSGLREEDKSDIQRAVRRREGSRLKDILRNVKLPAGYKKLILELPLLYGQADKVLKRAGELIKGISAKEAAASLQVLRDVYGIIKKYGVEEYILIDLGELKGFDYYTGIFFEIFSKRVSREIGSGGRYDNLTGRFGFNCPATGFALDVENILGLLERIGRLPRYKMADLLILDPKREALNLLSDLRKRGYAVIRDTHGELRKSVEYAKKKGIDKVLAIGVSGLKKKDVLLVDCRADKKEIFKRDQIASVFNI